MSVPIPEFILEPIPLRELRLDARYQRDLREDAVLAIVDNFRSEQFQPITVGMRGDGSLHIVDGQHRFAAARRMGWATVPCMIFESDGFEHEATVFERLQTHRAPLTVAQRWKARVARGEPKAVAITQIVQSLGLELRHNTKSHTSFTAFIACEKAYERGNLRDVLVLIIQAWDYDPTGFRTDFIHSISLFLQAMTAEKFSVDMGRLTTALGKIKPVAFLRETSIMGNVSASFMRRLLDSYNTGLRSGRLVVDDPAALLASVGAKKAFETGKARGIDYSALQKANQAQRTAEERSAASIKAAQNMTPEERSARTAKGIATRKRIEAEAQMQGYVGSRATRRGGGANVGRL